MGFLSLFSFAKFQNKYINVNAGEAKVLVFRDGRIIQVLSSSVVEGDMVFIVKGDIVPCDMMIAESKNLEIDISLL